MENSYVTLFHKIRKLQLITVTYTVTNEEGEGKFAVEPMLGVNLPAMPMKLVHIMEASVNPIL